MPRTARPHLYLDRTRNSWCIRDGARSIRTGCGAADKAGAEIKLAEYLASKYRPAPTPSPRIGDVILMYLEHRPKEKHCLNNLRPFWGGLNVADINAAKCREYAKGRPPVAARRDLEVLRAGINHYDKHVHPIERKPAITLPERPASRTRSLSRSDVGRLLQAAKGVPHLRRFLLLGFYTGSRAGAILDLRWGWIDLNRGIMHRREPGSADNKTKRRPPLKLGRRILAHLARWKRMDEPKSEHVVHYNGGKVTKLRRSWATAAKRSGVDASPHDLRRTRATILMSRGLNPDTIAQSLGMSVKVLKDTYTQYDPEWQKDVADVDR
jgi:integrase